MTINSWIKTIGFRFSIPSFSISGFSISGSGILFLLISSSSLANVPTDITLPSIGNDKSSRFTEAEEKLLGETFMRQVRLELAVSDDPEIAEYIQQLGFRLAANSEFKNRYFNFFIINDPQINAFAGPNGYIGVNAGLITSSRDEGELASVISHEIAHVAQRHLERSIDKQDNMSLPAVAAIITAIVLGSNANINITQAAIFAAIAANYESQLSFSRAHESEADHVGMKILTQAGFDPNSMPSFFEKLLQSNRYGDSQIPEFLRTHPVTTRRIAESRNRAAAYSIKPTLSSTGYFLAKAKLRVITNKHLPTLAKQLKAELQQGSYLNKLAQNYAYAHTLMRIEKYEQAREITQWLIDNDDERIPYSILQANIEIEDKKITTGLMLFKNALQLNPGNGSISLHYADALLTHKKPALAEKVLKSVKNYPITPTYLQLLAKAEGQNGKQGASHQTLAEYFLMFDQIHSALSHLKQALKENDTNERQKLRIKQRIKEIKEIAILEQQF